MSIVMLLIYICSCIYYNRQAVRAEENLVHQFRANLELELEHIKGGLYQPYERSRAYQVLTRVNRLDERDEVYALLQSISQLSDEIAAVRLEDTIQGRNYLYANRYCFVDAGSGADAPFDVGEEGKNQAEGFGAGAVLLPTHKFNAPETLPLLVPKMIIQPIMENYFKHGFVKREEGFRLRASSRIQEDRLVIEVENNGTGIPEEKLKSLLLNLERAKTFDNEEGACGIGLINIQSRLNLYYQNEGQISLYNLDPYGLRIEVILRLKAEVEQCEGANCR